MGNFESSLEQVHESLSDKVKGDIDLIDFSKISQHLETDVTGEMMQQFEKKFHIKTLMNCLKGDWDQLTDEASPHSLQNRTKRFIDNNILQKKTSPEEVVCLIQFYLKHSSQNSLAYILNSGRYFVNTNEIPIDGKIASLYNFLQIHHRKTDHIISTTGATILSPKTGKKFFKQKKKEEITHNILMPELQKGESVTRITAVHHDTANFLRAPIIAGSASNNDKLHLVAQSWLQARSRLKTLVDYTQLALDVLPEELAKEGKENSPTHYREIYKNLYAAEEKISRLKKNAFYQGYFASEGTKDIIKNFYTAKRQCRKSYEQQLMYHKLSHPPKNKEEKEQRVQQDLAIYSGELLSNYIAYKSEGDLSKKEQKQLFFVIETLKQPNTTNYIDLLKTLPYLNTEDSDMKDFFQKITTIIHSGINPETGRPFSSDKKEEERKFAIIKAYRTTINDHNSSEAEHTIDGELQEIVQDETFGIESLDKDMQAFRELLKEENGIALSTILVKGNLTEFKTFCKNKKLTLSDGRFKELFDTISDELDDVRDHCKEKGKELPDEYLGIIALNLFEESSLFYILDNNQPALDIIKQKGGKYGGYKYQALNMYVDIVGAGDDFADKTRGIIKEVAIVIAEVLVDVLITVGTGGTYAFITGPKFALKIASYGRKGYKLKKFVSFMEKYKYLSHVTMATIGHQGKARATKGAEMITGNSLPFSENVSAKGIATSVGFAEFYTLISSKIKLGGKLKIGEKIVKGANLVFKSSTKKGGGKLVAKVVEEVIDDAATTAATSTIVNVFIHWPYETTPKEEQIAKMLALAAQESEQAEKKNGKGFKGELKISYNQDEDEAVASWESGSSKK